MNKVKSIIREIKNSKYLNDWILKLKDEPTLFSIENIKPNLKVDDGYQFIPWDGLVLIKYYLKGNNENEEIDKFVIDLLKKSLSKYQNDNTIEVSNKLNSNFSIIDDLFSIAISKTKYIDNIDFLDLLKIYLDSVNFKVYQLIKYLKCYFRKLLNSKIDIFAMFKMIIDSNKLTGREVKYFIDDSIDLLIKKDVFKFYRLSFDEIYKKDLKCFDMSSFIDYNPEYIYNEVIDLVYFHWLKITSTSIDYNVLNNDINKLLSSNNKYHKKIGLALININFKKIEKIFYKKLNDFLNIKTYYTDLCDLLINNDVNYKKIKDKLVKSSFGIENKERINILRNHIKIIFNLKGIKVEYIPETFEMNNYVRNFNKLIKAELIDPQSEKDKLYLQIKDLDLEDVLKFYNDKKNSSSLLSETLNDAFIEYLSENNINLIDNFKNFDFSLIHRILVEQQEMFNEGIDIDICKLNVLTNKAIELSNEKKDYSIISTILSCIGIIINKKEYCLAFNLINSIRCEMLDIELIKYSVNDCINNVFFQYFYNYSNVAFNYIESRIEYIKVVEWAIKKNTTTLNGIIASQLPIISIINNELYSSNLDTLLKSNDKNYNFSYDMLGNVSICKVNDIFNNIKDRADFIDFIYSQTKECSYHSLVTYIDCIVKSLLYHDCENFLKIIFNTNNSNVVILTFDSILHYYKKNIKNNDIIKKYIQKIYNFIEANMAKNFDADNIIISISKMILKTNNGYNQLWDCLKLLFNKYYDYYFPEELFDVIKIYLDVEKDNIVDIIKIYLNKYDENNIDEEQLSCIINLFKSSGKYNDELKEFEVILTRIEPLTIKYFKN